MGFGRSEVDIIYPGSWKKEHLSKILASPILFECYDLGPLETKGRFPLRGLFGLSRAAGPSGGPGQGDA